MISPTKISIIILTYNAIEYTKRCINSIKVSTRAPYELIVIDNNSADGTQDWLKDNAHLFKHLILNTENKGVAGGRNQGIKLATGDIILFLDNDTELRSSWDSLLLGTFLKNRDVDIVGKWGNRMGNLNPLVWKICINRDRTGTFDVDVVPGFFFAFRKSILPLIGGEYEGLGTFWHEDLEFCLRAKKYGIKIMANTDIPVTHYGHKSAGIERPISDDEMKTIYPGFEEKAAAVEKRLNENNILTVFRHVHENCHESYCILADNLCRIGRQNSMIIYRRPSVLTNNKSFDLCKGFSMKYCGQRMVLMHVENDRPPKSWLKELKLVDHAFCDSEHAYHALLDIGVPQEKLINVALGGYDPDIYNTNVKPLEDFYPEKFKFMFVGATQPRKNIDGMLEAYGQTFTKKDPVVFIIKDYAYGQKDRTIMMIHNWQKKYPKAPEVAHIFEDWPSEKLAGVYRAVAKNGAYFHAHKAECLGQPIIEALACGCRVGTTDFGGPHYYGKDLATLFPYALELSTFHNWPGEPFYGPDEKPQWAIPDIEAMEEWMKKVYEAKNNPISAKTRSKKVEEMFSYNRQVERFLNEVRTLA